MMVLDEVVFYEPLFESRSKPPDRQFYEEATRKKNNDTNNVDGYKKRKKRQSGKDKIEANDNRKKKYG